MDINIHARKHASRVAGHPVTPGACVPWSFCNVLCGLAGVEGFEPPNGGIKTRCLTTWRHPKFNRVPLSSPQARTMKPRHCRGSCRSKRCACACGSRTPQTRRHPCRSAAPTPCAPSQSQRLGHCRIALAAPPARSRCDPRPAAAAGDSEWPAVSRVNSGSPNTSRGRHRDARMHDQEPARRQIDRRQPLAPAAARTRCGPARTPARPSPARSPSSRQPFARPVE